MLVKKISLICLTGGLLLWACGCAPSLIGTDAGIYSKGRLYAVASGDMTSVYNATVAALGKLEIEVTDKAKDVFAAKVIAKGADEKIITIRMTPGEGDLTNIKIGVSPFGNKERSTIIYEEIKRHLGKSSK